MYIYTVYTIIQLDKYTYIYMYIVQYVYIYTVYTIIQLDKYIYIYIYIYMCMCI